MAIQKVNLVNIVGHINEFDRSVRDYIIDQPIHLENTMDILEDAIGLYPFVYDNPYTAQYQQVRELMDLAGLDVKDMPPGTAGMEEVSVGSYCTALKSMLSDDIGKKASFEAELAENEQIRRQLEPMKEFDIILEELFDFEHIKFRFGLLPKDSYKKLNSYLGDLESFWFTLNMETDFVYGIYFAPEALEEKIDNIFSILYFERIRISRKAEGTPAQALEKIIAENQELTNKIAAIDKSLDRILTMESKNLYAAFRTVGDLYGGYNVRQKAAHTHDSFYIMGWMLDSHIEELEEKIKDEKSLTILIEEPHMCKKMPPTKLKNWKIFKPFEDFVQMYGLPSYNEIDPTVFFALTYVFMFGIMYGDIGHGLVMGLFGLYLGFIKGSFIGKIMVWTGISSIFFGFMYGSIFGDEHIITAIWVTPMEQMNTILISTVVLGVIVITVSMVFNMINGFKQKKMGRVLFGPNGLSGLIFYWAVIIAALSVFMGFGTPNIWYVIGLIFVPLAVIFMAEPLTHLIEKRKDWMPKNKGAFFLETFFEMFEVLLSYITNTISFVRVGAFALNHAGMMMVVMIFAKMMQGATGIIILILGNLLVIVLEGFLVGIQVLRLQFYEMFSRYFDGTGKPFESKDIRINE